MIDHPGSTKALVDRALVVKPMQRRRERICAASDLIVTPSAAILPPGTPRDKVIELEWGADTDRFHPGAEGPLPFTRPPGVLAVFAGAFRSWHGAVNLARAIKELEERGRTDVGALFIGDGPELARVRTEAAGSNNVIFTGALAARPHARVPGRRRHRRRPVRSRRAQAAGARVLLVAAEDLRVHGGRSAGRRALPPTGSRSSSKEASKVCSISRRRRSRAWPTRWSD